MAGQQLKEEWNPGIYLLHAIVFDIQEKEKKKKEKEKEKKKRKKEKEKEQDLGREMQSPFCCQEHPDAPLTPAVARR